MWSTTGLYIRTNFIFDLHNIGRGGSLGRGASLYRNRSQLFGRLWVRLPLPTGQFSEIELSAYNVVSVLRDMK